MAAGYQRIADEVLRRHGRWVKTCWIAHVRELNGLPVRRAWNRRPGPGRDNPCPRWARPLIEGAMRRFGLL